MTWPSGATTGVPGSWGCSGFSGVSGVSGVVGVVGVVGFVGGFMMIPSAGFSQESITETKQKRVVRICFMFTK
jgi:hypothetical protein